MATRFSYPALVAYRHGQTNADDRVTLPTAQACAIRTVPSLIACSYCDVVQREVPVAEGNVVRCVRCGATLYANRAHSTERTLALVTAAAIMFLVANAFPLLSLESNGVRSASTLFGAVEQLWGRGDRVVAGLVFTTTILAPAIELIGMLWLLVPLRSGRIAAGAALLLRLLQSVKPWGMVEVFMLGVLVSLVKLSHIASIAPGIALWCFGALMLLLAAAAYVFDAREVWHRMEHSR